VVYFPYLQNFQYAGYERRTNQHTENLGVTFFDQVSSCGTATAVSVPCMFSLQFRDSFDLKAADSQQNLLDLAALAGVDVLWIDNNNGCKRVCERVAYQQIDPAQDSPLCDGDYCFDEVMLAPLAAKLENIDSESTLIVLHMIGSHGPTYYRRYPHSARAYQPDCERSDIQNCSKAALVNTYDNTVLYSDQVNAMVIRQLQQYQDKYDVSLLYVSDHGESLGEKGLYLHGFPYALAPGEQTHVPLYVWSGSGSANAGECLADVRHEPLSHDNIYHSVMSLIGVESTLHDASLDIFSHC